MAGIDLGIAGRTALVCAASKGLGRACAMALAEAGADLVINARGAEALEAAAEEIRGAYGVRVTAVAADATTDDGRERLLAACPAPDILVTNAGGPPTGDFRSWDRAVWHAAIEANMLAPIFLIRGVLDGMIARRFGRIVNITSAAVKAPIPALGLSNGARSGLTGFVGGLCRQVVKHNVTINSLLPGPFETDRLRHNVAEAAKAAGKTFEETWAARRAASPAGRYGQPEEFGLLCAFLASERAGFITGQNIVVDGGGYPGVF
jgi:3-oxoacyl-[acyl-carrier protein] reductase